MLPSRLMHRSTLALLATGLAFWFANPAADANAAPRQGQSQQAPQKTLKPFGSENELLAFLKARQKKPEARKYYPPSAPPPPPAPVPAAAEASASADGASSITNTQEAGVDEGGIVKMKGDLLVVLRRGRIFTVSTRNGELTPIDHIDAFPPGINPRSDWYDEMLIAGDRVIVIGYSYGRGGTEINRFRLSSDGRLAYEDTYHLRSNDYYSSRNYASRLIGTRLVVYTPLYLPWNASENMNWLPALRRWRGTSAEGSFAPTASATTIFVPQNTLSSMTMPTALHSVTSCDLAAAELACSATGVLGGSGRTFYVSSNAVYVWVGASGLVTADGNPATAVLYRLPLDGGAPSAIGVRGMPTDQFSFREDAQDGILNVLVRSEGGGDAMWRPEFSSGTVSLLRVALNAFNDGSAEADRKAYRLLPDTEGNRWAFQNRFVGDYVLYGKGAGWDVPLQQTTVVAASVRGASLAVIPLSHGVDRIEAMGRDAVIIGGDGRDLHFRAIELTAGSIPQVGDTYIMAGASQGETRSHAFYFKPEAGSDAADKSAGLMGLPVTRAGRPGFMQLVENSSAIVFVRRSERRFSALGELVASDEAVIPDGCQASCVDWYGNSRPIFVGSRTFALMGYELVEGKISSRRIREVRRVSFAPVPARPSN